jgi:Zn-dependent protease with chaperone function
MMRSPWPAFYLDGKTAVRHTATLRLMREGLEISTENGWTCRWPYREIRQTQGFYPGEEVRLERGGAHPEVLVVSAVEFLISLRKAAPDLGRRFHDPTRRATRRHLTVLAGAGVIAATLGIYLWGIPTLAALAATFVPVSWEERVGQSALSQFAPPGRHCSDPQLRAAMDEILGTLTAPAPRSPYALRVSVVNTPLVNAIAVPGGHIVVFRGLLERTHSPEELAGVLAHELQHVLRRHATRAMFQGASTGLLLATISGDATGPLAYGLGAARALGDLSYSRQAEGEADADGMKMLLEARVDPAGMIDFFEVLAKEEGARPAGFKYLSSHPMADDRLARLKNVASGQRGTPVKLLPGTDWSRLIRLC